MTTTPASRAPLVGIGLVSALACGLLLWLLYGRDPGSPGGEAARVLPAVNATFNAASATCLVLGYRAIRRGDRRTHRALMLGAFALSTLFLAGYVTHHALHGDTRFVGSGAVKATYLAVLASHVVLSIVALPIVLTTFYFSLSGQLDRHRRLARYTFPIWLYVSVTGVLVFVLLETLSG